MNPWSWRTGAELARQPTTQTRGREPRQRAATSQVGSVSPKAEPAAMHDTHLANAISKAERDNDQTRLAELLAEKERR